MKKFILALALLCCSSLGFAQTIICGPNHFDVNGSPCANFTTDNHGALITNGPVPQFVVDSQDGVALTGDQFGGVNTNAYPGANPPMTGLTLPVDPLVAIGFPAISDGHLERIGTSTLTILGTRAKYPSKAPATLTYVYTMDLNAFGPELLNGIPLGFNWSGTLAVTFTFTGRYVCGGGRYCVTHVPVYSIGTGVGEVSATPVLVP
jgi:hypothetical protein